MKLKLIITALAILATAQIGEAADVSVNGYYRKDGTYVAPHVRSSPDSDRGNNYGSSENSYQRTNPTTRDADHDGVPNYRDRDDNNNGISDNQEKKRGW